MVKYLIKKSVTMVITLLIIATITFFLSYLLPGGPYQDPSKMTPAVKVVFDAKYGLDQPLPVQYAKYMGNLLQGDLGISYKFTNRSVNQMIKDYFPASAQLGAQAILIGVPLGLLAGIIAALYRGKIPDYVAVFIAILGVSVPAMVLGTLFQYFLGLKLGWFPVARWGTFEHTILPSLTLAVAPLAIVTRLIRTSMLDVLGSDYLRTAKSKGLNKIVITWRHAIRNALLPVITILGTLIVNLITGSLVVEQIFSVPGLGQHFVQSIYTNDYSLIMGITIFYSALFIFAVFITDVLYSVIDPRIRIIGKKE